MSDAAEYRLNALICEESANAAHSPLDRGIWLSLRRTWLKLAAKEEHREASAAEKDAGSVPASGRSGGAIGVRKMTAPPNLS
jgi:hypothetical protein